MPGARKKKPGSAYTNPGISYSQQYNFCGGRELATTQQGEPTQRDQRQAAGLRHLGD